MSWTALAFYLFSSIAVLSAFMVIAARNPVHSVLYLILTFFNAAALFLLLGAEFLAMILVIVYVGAVAVLFLFVVMMLNINYVELREGFLHYLPIGALIALVVLLELVFVLGAWTLAPGLEVASKAPPIAELSNIAALGSVIFTQYVYAFQASGMILLVAMVGAIVLTLRTRDGVKKQNIADQVSRRASDAVEIKKVNVGEGI